MTRDYENTNQFFWLNTYSQVRLAQPVSGSQKHCGKLMILACVYLIASRMVSFVLICLFQVLERGHVPTF